MSHFFNTPVIFFLLYYTLYDGFFFICHVPGVRTAQGKQIQQLLKDISHSDLDSARQAVADHLFIHVFNKDSSSSQCVSNTMLLTLP